ncbi:hypothetical protein OHA10_17365 [Kribbella sp. NBC_00662]|uniref:hypothetical protein n=1 Tax=Kribbella sp. NBC_00662 TaxID=2975969 RepID=UPI003243D622
MRLAQMATPPPTPASGRRLPTRLVRVVQVPPASGRRLLDPPVWMVMGGLRPRMLLLGGVEVLGLEVLGLGVLGLGGVGGGLLVGRSGGGGRLLLLLLWCW